MFERKSLLKIFTYLGVVLLLTGVLPGTGTAAPSEKPIIGKEWMAKTGMDWGPKYYPAKPVRGGIANYASALYVGLMNPNHWPVNDWVTIRAIYDNAHYDRRELQCPPFPGWPSPGNIWTR